MARGRDYAKDQRAPSSGGGGKSVQKSRRRQPGKAGKGSLPVWVWAVLAVSLVLGGAAIYSVSRPAVPMQFSPGSSDAKNRAGSEPKIEIPPREAPTYDFYSMLPNDQVQPDVDAANPGREARPPPPPDAASVVADAPSPVEPDVAVAPQPERVAALAPLPSTPAMPSTARIESAKAKTLTQAPKPPEPRPVIAQPEPKRAEALAPLASPASAASASRYMIQTAAVRNLDDAERSKAALALSGFAARIEAAEVDGNTWYRVRLGPYANREAAQGVLAQLAGSGQRGVLLPAP